MAYNGFPASYQPVYYPQQFQQYQQLNQPQLQQPINQSPQSNSSIIWVQGEAGAKSYLVAPNTTVQLWDSENQVIYLKSADASGMPSMKVLDYKIRESNQPTQQFVNLESNNISNYVTRDELEKFESQIQDQIKNLIPITQQKSRVKKEERQDE